MTNFEETLLREISTMPESRRADVLAFVRFLKISMKDHNELDGEYDEAIEDARATARKYNIKEEDIDAEIRAVRESKGK